MEKMVRVRVRVRAMQSRAVMVMAFQNMTAIMKRSLHLKRYEKVTHSLTHSHTHTHIRLPHLFQYQAQQLITRADLKAWHTNLRVRLGDPTII